MRFNLNNQYTADFETTTEAPTRVWLWQIRHIQSDKVTAQGTRIEDFFENCPPNATIYFHNLAFDAFFMLDFLLKNGYKWVELDNSMEGRALGLDRVHPGQFTTLIGEMGQFYELKLNAGHGEVTMRDSLKKVPGALRELAVAYGAPVLKGETPLHATLPEDYEPTPKEWDYMDGDTGILAHVLRAVFSEGLTKMTIGGDCFAAWRKIFHEDFKEGEEKEAETFRRVFPILDRPLDEQIRKAYRGGWTYARPAMQGRVHTGGGRTYDVNSLYPAVQTQERFPIGKPIELNAGENAPASHPFTISGRVVSFTLNENYLPAIPNSTLSFGGSGWAEEGECVELWATDEEWALFEEHYELTTEAELGGFAFRVEEGSKLFGRYIDIFMQIKATTKGPKRMLAKLLLNNLWGKFGTNPHRVPRIPTLSVTDNVVEMRAGAEEYSDAVYTPVAVATTAAARIRTIRAAQANYDRFAYADTDSLHLLGDFDPIGLTVHDSKIGAWAHEGTWTEAIFCRAKAYVERMAHAEEGLLEDPETGLKTISVAMAGLPAEAREGLTPESVFDGMTFEGKLARKRVEGGLILAPVAWKLDYRFGVGML